MKTKQQKLCKIALQQLFQTLVNNIFLVHCLTYSSPYFRKQICNSSNWHKYYYQWDNSWWTENPCDWHILDTSQCNVWSRLWSTKGDLIILSLNDKDPKHQGWVSNWNGNRVGRGIGRSFSNKNFVYHHSKQHENKGGAGFQVNSFLILSLTNYLLWQRKIWCCCWSKEGWPHWGDNLPWNEDSCRGSCPGNNWWFLCFSYWPMHRQRLYNGQNE